MTARFSALLFAIWYPLCVFGLWFAAHFHITTHNILVAAYLFVMMVFVLMDSRQKKVILDIDRLPAFEALSTAHWSSDEQIQFAKAVAGIQGIEWLREAAPDADSHTRDRIATAFAFAAFSELRRRMHLAPDEELMKDSAGRSSPTK